MQVITQDLECSFESKNVQLQILYTKICTNGQGISIVKVHYRITILNGYISYFYLDLNVDIMILFFSFLSKQTKKRFREEVKWGCFVGF